MSQIIPPSPVDSPFGSYNWADWYEKVRRAINNATGTIPVTQGGTGITSYTAGDTIYASATNILSKLAIGTPGQVYTVNPGGSAPIWATPVGLTNPMTTAGDIIIGGVAGLPTRLAATTNGWVLTLVSGAPSWVASAGGGLTYTYNTTAPSSPNVGDFWFDPTAGVKFTWVNDGTSTQWVEC